MIGYVGWQGSGEHHKSSGLHQHPHSDHVRIHVSGNADASHRSGWALRWRAEAACGLNVGNETGMRDKTRPSAFGLLSSRHL
ncbi:unnamed protein product [Menidia menidia]|uniref:(Atlantic silverside) hypothetical protein n=1 Tax=Menidia menidia TaxID=238744 RepID=A0A8S4ABU4_9TELE|nr:unnamed protein product [Menidia menidia]